MHDSGTSQCLMQVPTHDGWTCDVHILAKSSVVEFFKADGPSQDRNCYDIKGRKSNQEYHFDFKMISGSI